MSLQIAIPGDIPLVGPRRREQMIGATQARDGSLSHSKRQPRSAATQITIEIATGARLAELGAAWRDLIGRADAPNVFMNPAIVRVAGEAYPAAQPRVLLAWQDEHRRRLVGLWAFALRRVPQSILPINVLTAPPWTHAYLSTPVVDRDALDATLNAMLDHIAGDRALPKIVALDDMGADGQTAQALARVIAFRGSASCIFGQSVRPKLASELDAKSYMKNALSNASRKKLRQHRRRLAEKGALEFRIVSEPEAVGRALEDFLLTEAAGWKGRQGTALLSDNADTAFARGMVATLAPHGDASIHGLYLNGRPVSMQVVLRAGRTAFTWKTAYDEVWHDVSPGMLLFEDYTAAFLGDDSIAFVDSCAYDATGFMATWGERQAMKRLWIDVRRGRSVAFTILSRLQKAYLVARGAAKAIYLARARKRTR